MFVGEVDADGNGILLFCPSTLRRWYGGDIPEGKDLLHEFLTTDAGDEVLSVGAIVPILAITSAGYEVCVRLESDPSHFDALGYVLECENSGFGLNVRGGLFVADLAVIREWMEGVDWHPVTGIPDGNYIVAFGGWTKHDSRGTVVGAGYEFVLSPTRELPRAIPDTGLAMNLFP